MATTTRYVGTCAVCQNRIKVRGGTLVHHGYERPGDGYIVGDCFGVHQLPHETSPETAKAYREVLVAELNSLAAQKAHVEGTEELPYKYTEGYRSEKREVRVMVSKGDQVRYEGMQTIPSFESLQQSVLNGIRRKTETFERDVTRLTQWIDTWTKQDLTTVEEETAKGRSEAQAKRDVKNAARDQKKAEKARRDAARAASAQAKIDKAIAKCLPILDAVDPTDIEMVRKAYAEILNLKLPITDNQRWGFFEKLGRTEILKAAGCYHTHNGMLFSYPVEIYRLPAVKK